MTLPAQSSLPYGRQLVEEDDIAAVVRALKSAWLTTGPEVDAFETAFADRVEAKFAISCANGTAALHMAALAMGLGPGDRVIVPSMTFLATVNAPNFTGAEIVFADCDPDTGLLTPATLSEAIARAGGSVKAAFVVHLNGQACDMAALRDVVRDHNIAIVEDACHALGTTYRVNGTTYAVGGCPASIMATFSFHPVKTITSGEGGMVTTNDPDLAARLRNIRHHGMERDQSKFVYRDRAFDASGAANPWYYEMPAPGWNYRLTDIQAALGRSQLAKLDRFAARRAELVDRYDAKLSQLCPAVRPIARMPNCKPVWHLYPVLIDFAALGIERGALMRALAARGVGTQVHYIPVHRQPYYRHRNGQCALPGADRYYARALSLPLFAAMQTTDVDRVVTALAISLKEVGASI
jgi:UDP-4-amino-4,6-dideoxy-N-acetyl-beta-L-altrosamine transaminase